MSTIAGLETSSATDTICASCGHDAWATQLPRLRDYLTQEIFQIDSCQGCGLRMTRPLPPTEAIGRYYPPRYRGNRHAFTGPVRSMLRQRAVQKCFPPGFRGRLLDIGCGDGSFALHMKQQGWDVCATEIDCETVDELCLKHINAKLPWDAERDGFGEKFDAITCWHVMEHLEHPRLVCDWVASQLNPAGIFQATVPNADSMQARIFGKHWVHLDVPRHRQHYTTATLKLVLKQAGFSIRRQSNFALEYDWFGIIQSALNAVCSRPNVLFDILTHAPKDSARPISIKDAALSYWLMCPIALASLPLMLCAAALGDGATLTLTCNPTR